jgi:lysozyme
MSPRNMWLAGSASAVAAIVVGLTAWEGNAPKSYDDVAGIATACIGHTENVQRGRVYTKAECDAFLKQDLQEHTAAVLRCVNVPISEKTYTALVLFSFNVGATRFCNASLVSKLNQGDYRAACDGLLAWNKARVNGQLVEIKGLTRRRNAERALCLEGLT